MSGEKKNSITPQATRSRIGQWLQTASLVLLLMIVCGRCFLGDMSFRSSAIKNVGVLVSSDRSAAAEASELVPDRGELSRVSMSMLTLIALAFWAVGALLEGRLRIRNFYFTVIALCFVLITAASAFRAVDQRSAWDSWFEQVAFILTCFLAVQLCSDRRRYALAIVILAATAITLGIKGMLQAGFEFPWRIAQFSEDKVNLLQKMGYDPASPQARAFEARAMDDSVYGFLGLSNPFASIILVTLGVLVGLAADKFIFARRYDRQNASQLGGGKVSLPMMSALLTAMMIAPAGATLYYTRSRGAMLSVLIVAIASTIIFFVRRRLADKWRRVFLACVCTVIIALGVVAAWGLKFDSLPGKSMTFRWFYWSSSAKVVADSPVVGVGPGNFGGAYLAHRRAEAEEAVKSPHNTVMQAACEYGLVGGALFLAAIILILYSCTKAVARPSPASDVDTVKAPSLVYAAIFPAWIVVVRLILGGPHDDLQMIADLTIPAVAMAGGILLCRWCLDEHLFSPDRAGAFMLAGLAAFFLHSMLEVSFWIPSSAGIFWLAAGVCASQGGGAEVAPQAGDQGGRGVWWKGLILTVLAIVAAGYSLWWPVAQRYYWTQRAFSALCSGDSRQAVDAAVRAASADPYDHFAALDASNIILHCIKSQDLYGVEKAYDLARRATDANLRDPMSAVAAGRIAIAVGKPAAAVEYFKRAVLIDPSNMRLRIECAAAMKNAGDYDGAMEHLRVAREINARLKKFDPTSVECLTDDDRKRIEQIELPPAGATTK